MNDNASALLCHLLSFGFLLFNITVMHTSDLKKILKIYIKPVMFDSKPSSWAVQCTVCMVLLLYFHQYSRHLLMLLSVCFVSVVFLNVWCALCYERLHFVGVRLSYLHIMIDVRAKFISPIELDASKCQKNLCSFLFIIKLF